MNTIMKLQMPGPIPSPWSKAEESEKLSQRKSLRANNHPQAQKTQAGWEAHLSPYFYLHKMGIAATNGDTINAPNIVHGTHYLSNYATSSTLFLKQVIWKTHIQNVKSSSACSNWSRSPRRVGMGWGKGTWKEARGFTWIEGNWSLHWIGSDHSGNCSILLFPPSYPPSARITQRNSTPNLQKEKTWTDTSQKSWWVGHYFNMNTFKGTIFTPHISI